MKSTLSSSLLPALGAAILISWLPMGALADTRTKANNASNLNATGSWVGGVVPGATDIALWDTTVTAATAANFFNTGGNVTWGQIAVTNPGGAITIINNTITLNGVSGVGIDLSTAAQDLTINSNITVNGPQAWQIGTGRTLFIHGAVTNNNALAITGTGNLVTSNNITVNAAGSHSGNTTVRGGTFTLNGAGTLANTSSVTITGGTMAVGANTGTGVADRVNALASLHLGGMNGGGTFTLTAGASSPTNTQTLASLNIGPGLNVINNTNGAGTLVFTGAGGSGYTRMAGGFINFNANSVSFANAPTAAGGSSVTSGGGNEILIGATLADEHFVRAADGSVAAAIYENNTFGTGLNTNVTDNLSALGGITTQSLRMTANFTLTLDNVNTIESGMIMNGVNGTATITGGSLRTGAGRSFLIYTGGSKNLTINSVLENNAGATGFEKYGTGTVNLGGANTFTGSIYLHGGFVELRHNQALGLGDAAMNIVGGTTIRLASAASNVVIDRDIILYGSQGIAFDTNGAGNQVTFNGTLSANPNPPNVFGNGGTSTFTKTGEGTLLFAGNTDPVDAKIGLNISGGLLDITGSFVARENWGSNGGDSSTAVPIIRVRGNGVLTNGSLDWNFVNTNGRFGVLEVQDNAQVTFGRFYVGKQNNVTATVNQTGGTVTVGVLGMDNDSFTNMNSTYNLDGGRLMLSGNGQVIVGPGARLNFNGGTIESSGNSNIGQAGNGAGAAIVKAGGAKFNQTNNTQTVHLALQHDSALGSTLDGGLEKSGNGILLLNAANTFTGDTKVNGGTLRLANSLALQYSTVATGGAGIVFDSSVTSNAFTFGGLDGSANLVLQNNAGSPAAVALSVGHNDRDASYSGILSGAGSFTKIGDGVQTLSGNNSYSGGTNISAGTLVANHASALGSGAVTISSGVSLQVGDGPAGQELVFGHTLANSGTIELDIFNTTGSGTFSTGAADYLTFGATFGGNLGNLTLSNLAGSEAFMDGARFYLVDWGSVAVGNRSGTLNYDTATFAGLGFTYEFDESGFFNGGYITIMSVPEPSRVLLLAAALGSFLLRRHRIGTGG